MTSQKSGFRSEATVPKCGPEKKKTKKRLTATCCQQTPHIVPRAMGDRRDAFATRRRTKAQAALQKHEEVFFCAKDAVGFLVFARRWTRNALQHGRKAILWRNASKSVCTRTRTKHHNPQALATSCSSPPEVLTSIGQPRGRGTSSFERRSWVRIALELKAGKCSNECRARPRAIVHVRAAVLVARPRTAADSSAA